MAAFNAEATPSRSFGRWNSVFIEVDVVAREQCNSRVVTKVPNAIEEVGRPFCHAQETNLVRACGGSLFSTSCPRSPVLYINHWYILCLPLSFLLPFQVAPSTGLYRSSQSIRLPSALRRRNLQPNPWCLYDRRFSSQHSLSRLHPFAGHLSSSVNSVLSALPTPPGATLGGRINRNTKLYHLCALTFLCCQSRFKILFAVREPIVNAYTQHHPQTNSTRLEACGSSR